MEDVVFQENGTRVASVNPKTYIFERNMSRGPESDLIRTVNIPAMVSSRNPLLFFEKNILGIFCLCSNLVTWKYLQIVCIF